MQPEKNYDLVLSTLLRHGVEFIVVGGVSAVLHGAPYDTFDVDVVHARAATNLERLVDALEELDAVYRMMMSRRLRPPLSALEGPGHQLLMTRHGPLDVLGEIGDGMG
ncbi:MAG: hypothetical protein HZB13_19375, partial [Acidobacteria bacterium]|nr:hypothetical protein [Acidobacteriota bacterium]